MFLGKGQGKRKSDGERGSAQTCLKKAAQIHSTYGFHKNEDQGFAFAALRKMDRVTWRDPHFGGNSWDVQAQLHNMRHIPSALLHGFAAIRLRRFSGTWCLHHYDRWRHCEMNYQTTQDKLHNAIGRKSTPHAFAAI